MRVTYNSGHPHVSLFTNACMQLLGSIFKERGTVGDFAWMIEQREYADALFIFNDNEEQFRAFQDDSSSADGCSAGGGNAVIRPYRCADPPRAAGVPTGWIRRGGYPLLTPSTKQVITESIAVVDELVQTGRYKRVFYSAADAGGTLGTGIFNVGDDVKAYIVSELRRVVTAE